MDGERYPLDRNPADIAKANGWVCIEATDYMLQLDIDAKNVEHERIGHFSSLNETERRWSDAGRITAEAALIEKIGIDGTVSTTSPGGNRHFYYKLCQPLGIQARIALQAALGSDPARETLNTLRVVNGIPIPVVLFETQEEAEKVYGLFEEAAF